MEVTRTNSRTAYPPLPRQRRHRPAPRPRRNDREDPRLQPDPQARRPRLRSSRHPRLRHLHRPPQRQLDGTSRRAKRLVHVAFRGNRVPLLWCTNESPAKHECDGLGCSPGRTARRVHPAVAASVHGLTPGHPHLGALQRQGRCSGAVQSVVAMLVTYMRASALDDERAASSGRRWGTTLAGLPCTIEAIPDGRLDRDDGLDDRRTRNGSRGRDRRRQRGPCHSERGKDARRRDCRLVTSCSHAAGSSSGRALRT